ncbi:MAG: hypothetical protein ACR2O3_12770 [Rhizobiaceae bacterium]
MHNEVETAIDTERGHMEQQSDMSNQFSSEVFRKWGFWSVLIGALALLLVFIQFIGPTFESKPSAATQIGEIAGEIKRSAWRSFFGLPPAEQKIETASVWNYLAMAAPILGIAAVILSLISGVLRENWRFPVYGASLGASAIVFQYLWWVALLVCGVIILVAIIENIGDIFSF